MRNHLESPVNEIRVPPNPFERVEDRLRSFRLRESERIMTGCQARLLVFELMQDAIQEKKDPNFSRAEEVYAEDCGLLVPYSDYEFVYRKAKREGKRPPAAKKFYRSRVLEIMARDIEVAKKFTSGVVIGTEIRGLEWLIETEREELADEQRLYTRTVNELNQRLEV